MVRSLLSAFLLLALAACGKEEAKAPEPDASGGPQIATSIEDYSLPVDRSDQVTAIDAATGDASGMPKDGGAVVVMPKPEARPLVVEPVGTVPAPPPPAPIPPVQAPPAPAVAG